VNPPLRAAFNLRDLGGLPTQDGGRVHEGLLWRSDTLHRLDDEDLQALGQLGLRTVVDLRSPQEVSRWGQLRVTDDGPTLHDVPLFTDVRDLALTELTDEDTSSAVSAMVELYASMLAAGGPAIARAVTLLGAEGALPAVFHCTAGKDRTGLIAALVLAAVGVGDDDIVRDYARTEEAAGRTLAWMAEHEPESHQRLRAYPAWVLRSHPATMQGFLDRIRARHGSVTDLLVEIGVAQETIDRLAETLVEPAGA
jgi:protein-tyrosine phosphatase